MDTTDKTKLNFGERLLYPLPLIAFVIVWHFYTAGDQSRQFIFSTPEKVWQALERTIISGELLANCQVTVTEALAGFILGTTI